jgi:hypothetical protein
MRLWVFILFGLCFLFASSITSGKFMPRSSRERTIAIVLIAFLVLLAGWAIWQLLPYYSQPGAARVSQPSIPEYTPLRSTPVSRATPTPQETARASTPVRFSEVVTITPADPKVITITKPISIAVQHGNVGVAAGTKLPFVSRAGDKVRIRYYDGADYDVPISATDLKLKATGRASAPGSCVPFFGSMRILVRRKDRRRRPCPRPQG